MIVSHSQDWLIDCFEVYALLACNSSHSQEILEQTNLKERTEITMSYERQSCWQGQTGGTGGDHDKRCTGEVQGQRIFIRTGDLEVRSLRNMRKIISDWKFVVMNTFWSIKKFSRNTMDFLISQNHISISVSITRRNYVRQNRVKDTRLIAIQSNPKNQLVYQEECHLCKAQQFINGRHLGNKWFELQTILRL